MYEEDIFDIVTTVLVFSLFIVITVAQIIDIRTGDFGGFGTLVEKTAIQNEREMVPQEETFTRSDIIFMIAIADHMMTEPKVIELEGVPITIDGIFLENRTTALQLTATVMATEGVIKRTLYSGPAGPRKWVFNYD